MTIGEFWNQQEFAYLVTYSFNRGPKLAALREAAKLLFQLTRKKLLTSPAAQLPALREQLRLLERTYDLDLLTLTQGNFAFHITASPVVRIGKNDIAAQDFEAILREPVLNRMHWMCAPIYRDALAFYDAHDNLVSVLNICFSCDRMVTDTGREVQADTTTYQILRDYLIQLGHLTVTGER
ncbi:hypothetical protein A0257_20325 [Hymenobacter psoromatis]|nr:hypothetical protein A0257_20325 [Hymenobacter psoromatis]